MKLTLHQKQTQTQQLQLSPMLLQSLQILQMSNLQLVSHINAAAMENPFIDFLDDTAVLRDRPFAMQSHPIDPDKKALQTPALSAGFEDSVLLQLSMLRLPPEQERIARFLIANLDGNGFLTMSIEASAAMLRVQPDSVLQALRHVQQLEPAGIGARDAKECLLLQVQRRPDAPKGTLEIITNHLHALSEKNYSKIMAKAKLSKDALTAAVRFIRTLQPFPYNSKAQAPAIYVRPDVYISVDGDTPSASENSEDLPRVHINSEYLDLLSGSTDEDTKHYLKEQLKKARTLQKQVNAKHETRLRIAGAIAALQADFFSGKTETPIPLRLADAAELIGMSTATVSRAVNEAYLSCERGTFPFSYFFPRNATNDGISPMQIQQKLLLLLNTEDPAHPLSDQKLAERINASMQTTVSRRTIAKYRDMLSIPNASCRRSAAELEL